MKKLFIILICILSFPLIISAKNLDKSIDDAIKDSKSKINDYGKIMADLQPESIITNPYKVKLLYGITEKVQQDCNEFIKDKNVIDIKIATYDSVYIILCILYK